MYSYLLSLPSFASFSIHMQEAQPAVYLPPPLGGFFKSTACRQLAGIFEDILAEAHQIRQGQPTLWQGQGPQ